MSPPSSRIRTIPLAVDEVQVWSAAVDRFRSALPWFERLLSAAESARATRYRFVEDRELFVLGRGLLRVLLAGYSQQDACELRLGSGAVGKPYLAEEEGLSSIRFNVSHSHGQVLMAFSRQREVGVDIEQIREIDDLVGLSKRYFADEEQADLARRSDAERGRHFFTIWTLKEAYLKATGLGLTLPLDSFYVAIDRASDPDCYVVNQRNSAESNDWRLQSLSAPAGFAAAIAVFGSELEGVEPGGAWHLCKKSGRELTDLFPPSALSQKESPG